MILGNGDIASVLIKSPKTLDESFLFFASGVSNSQEENEEEYVRELDLLRKQDASKHIVYFSTLSIFYNDNRYTKHKLQMEVLVKAWFKEYTIVRIGNITWGKNPHTIINFIKNKLANGETVEIQDTFRYIVNEEEFLHWINLIPYWSCEMNITGKRMKVKEIVEKYCK